MLQVLLDAGADPDPPADRGTSLIESRVLAGDVPVLEHAAATRTHSG
jgi:hypothetical protein